MAVGRINYLHLEPLSFEEFVKAKRKLKLIYFSKAFDWNSTIPMLIYRELLDVFREHIIIDRLPAAITNWIETQSLEKVNQIHHDLPATFRDDLAKCAGRVPLHRLNEVLISIPRMLDRKFIYSQVNCDIQSSTIKQAIQLLIKVRLCHRVQCCSANAIPLAAEMKENVFKIIFLEVGLVSAMLGLKLMSLKEVQDIFLSIKRLFRNKSSANYSELLNRFI